MAKGGPAHLCGLIEIGDSILKIDGEAIIGCTPQQVLDRLYPRESARMRAVSL